MNIYLGEKGLKNSWQEPFNKTEKCSCGGEARIMFVVQELAEKEGNYVCNLRDNGGEGELWPHDAIAVAVYLCRKCFEVVAKINQA